MTIRIGILLVACLGWAATASGALLESYFERHCFDCHSGKSPEGNLDLANIRWDFSDSRAFDLLVKILDRIAKQEMPPREYPQPTRDDAAAVVKWLDSQLHDVDMATVAREGRAATRRLTNSEYENTLRDLLVLPALDVRGLLSADGRVAGYHKIGDGLDMSPVHLAAYAAAAEEAISAAIATRSTPPPVMRRRIYPASVFRFKYNLARGSYVLLSDMRPDSTLPFGPPPAGIRGLSEDEQQIIRYQFYDEHEIAKSRSAVGMLMANVGDTFAPLEVSPIHPGRHRVRLSAWAFTWDKGEVKPVDSSQALVVRAHKEHRENREGRTLANVTAVSLTPKEYEIEAWLDPSESLVLDPVSIPWFGSTLSISGEGRWATANHIGPGIAIDWVDYEGPIHPSWPPESHQRLFGDLEITKWRTSTTQVPPRRSPTPLQSAYWPRSGVDMSADEQNPPLESVQSSAPEADSDRLIAAFLPLAFRRPVTRDEVAPYVSLARMRLAAGDCFEDAMRRAYIAILTSPEFLFHPQDVENDDHALACRLSYWLWNSPPDDVLCSAAAAGKLRDPIELRQQVDRLLNDTKSQRFIDDFLDQWLGLNKADETTPDGQLYPEYSILLHESMVAETRSFFTELLAKDMPIRMLVDAPFTMLSQRLAEHYGIPGVDGVDVRRVDIPTDSHRGGLLTQAAILKLTANGTTTSPVKRGVWVIDRLLDDPVPPPPPGVAAIEPDTRGAKTVREQLALHRSSSDCATCHAKIDPAGFAMEAFDPVGKYRTSYRVLGQGESPPEKGHTLWEVNYRVGPPVDTSGELADGRAFAGIDGLKRLLADDEGRLARAFVGHMARYATGADLRYSDRREIDAIVASTRSTGYGVRSLIQALAKSRLVTSR